LRTFSCFATMNHVETILALNANERNVAMTVSLVWKIALVWWLLSGALVSGFVLTLPRDLIKEHPLLSPIGLLLLGPVAWIRWLILIQRDRNERASTAHILAMRRADRRAQYHRMVMDHHFSTIKGEQPTNKQCSASRHHKQRSSSSTSSRSSRNNNSSSVCNNGPM